MKGYRTLILNGLVALGGVFAAFDWTVVSNNPQITGIIVGGVGIANMILRTLTNTAVASKT